MPIINKKTKESIIEQKPFLYICVGSLIGILFYQAFFTYQLSVIDILFSALPSILSIFIVVAVESSDEHNLDHQSILETPTKQSLSRATKQAGQFERVICYNPALQVVMEPLNIRNLFHAITHLPALVVLMATLAVNLIMHISTKSDETSLASSLLFVAGAYLLINVASYISLDVLNYIRVLRCKEGVLEQGLIHTSYTQISLSRQIQDLNVSLGNKYQGEENILLKLNRKCHKAAGYLNDLVATGRIEPEFINKEKAFIEYSINEFIPFCIKDIKEFFEKQAEPSVIRKAFNETGRVELEKAIYPMLDKAGKILEAIIKIEKDLERKNIESFKNKIGNKDWAGLNNPNSALEFVSPYFQEYHLLDFPSLESKVVANNIVKKTLPKLISLESEAQGADDLTAIREQIASTKRFVKSIAVGTEESEQRKKRIQKELESSPLYLESESTNNPVQNLAQANQRYLETLDKTLPTE